MQDHTDLSDEQLDAHLDATVLDVPSPVTAEVSQLTREKLSQLPPMSGLSPAMQDRIRVNMSVNRHLSEQDAILQELQANSWDYRIAAGAGEGANAYQVEHLNIAREAREIKDEIMRTKARLDEVSHYDRETGEPVMRLTGDVRRDVQGDLYSLVHRYDLRTGPEMQKRLADAKVKAREEIRAKQQERDDAAEVERRVAHNVREARISREVEAKTRMRTPVI